MPVVKSKVAVLFPLLPALAIGLFGGLFSTTAQAGDWPQILGPNRDGVAEDEELLEKWPAKGPKQLWSYSLGSGYAAAAPREVRLQS